jgi:hypothetical protein
MSHVVVVLYFVGEYHEYPMISMCYDEFIGPEANDSTRVQVPISWDEF